MPSTVELVELAAASYSSASSVSIHIPEKPKAGTQVFRGGDGLRVWKTISEPLKNRVGFYAVSYQFEKFQVIAFRGTDDWFDTLIDDTAILVGSQPPQIAAALSAVTRFGATRHTYLTGHSLGGALAILAACKLNLPAVSFNAPGVRDACVVGAASSITKGLKQLLDELSRCVSNPRVKNLRIEADPVSSLFTTGLQAGGRAVSMKASSCGFDPLCRHGVQTCVTAVRADPRNFLDLTL